MTSIIALTTMTGGTNVTVRKAELQELGLEQGKFTVLSGNDMDGIRLNLAKTRGGVLPLPRSGGSVANTADLIARAGLDCGILALGGNDAFGKSIVDDGLNASMKMLLPLKDGAVTGYDFYLEDEEGVRTILLTHGANAQLGPKDIDETLIQNADLVILDGCLLICGPEPHAALAHCAQLAQKYKTPFVLTLGSIGIVNAFHDLFLQHAPRAQFVAGNREQTAALLGLDTTTSLEPLQETLFETEIDAIVTLDAEGVFARFGDQSFLTPTAKVNVVDSVGAGDNFLGAFIVAQQRGFSIQKSLEVGNFLAGHVIQYPSARLPLDIDIAELIRQVLPEPV